MPTYRIGVGSDFVLKNQRVGIGTQDPRTTLDVVGTLKGDFDVSGITTLTSYGGFIPQKQNISTASTIGFNTTGIGTVGITSFISVNEKETGFISLVGEFNTLSEDLIVDDGKILDVSTIRNIGVTTIGTQNVYVPTNTTVSLGTLESLNIASHFSVPNGGTSSRQQHPVEGMVRFNDDLNTLEFYNGVEWRQFTVTGASGRGVFGGGYTPSVSTSSISYINISSTGNALNFGTLSTAARIDSGSFSNSTRGVFHLGIASPVAQTNILEYITIASEGNSIDFGDLTSPARNRTSALSNSTRGIVAGGFTPSPTNTYFNTLDYIQIQTLGNALDFGDLQNLTIRPGCVSSPTRGIFVGGVTPSTNLNSISFVNIASTGNAVDFGGTHIFSGSYLAGGVSNGVRGIIAGGESAGSVKRKDIAYLTIASTGNSTYFGDLTIAKSHLSGCSSSTRGIYVGGDTPTYYNTLEYIIIASTGNAVDFGDDVITASRRGALSDSHGGLGGF